MLRALLPNCPGVISAGLRNAAVLNQRCGVRWSAGRSGSPMSVARVEFVPMRAASTGAVTVKGAPLW